MKRRNLGILALIAMVFSFLLMGNAAWALKNVCPKCLTFIQYLELTARLECGWFMNKCLQCGEVNPAKNDSCSKCSANMAEFRVFRSIEKEIRDDLRLGESKRAKIEVELAQLTERIALGGLISDIAAKAGRTIAPDGMVVPGKHIGDRFFLPVSGSRASRTGEGLAGHCLKEPGFSRVGSQKNNLAKMYLKSALVIDPKDKKSEILLKMAGKGK